MHQVSPLPARPPRRYSAHELPGRAVSSAPAPLVEDQPLFARRFPVQGSDAGRSEALAGRDERARVISERQAEVLRSARTVGFQAGERHGYTRGWQWGVVCGVALTVCAIGLFRYVAQIVGASA